jgi:EAL and modified HD-GYP domain-containing signal transduction protein
LLIKGRPLLAAAARGAAVLQAYSIIDLADERRDGMPPPGGVSRNIPHVQAGVRPRADEPMPSARRHGRAGLADRRRRAGRPGGPCRPARLSAIVELINRVDARRSPSTGSRHVLKNDPTLAFRLLRYINSPAFGLSRRGQLVPPRHDAARLPAPEALAGAAAGLGQQGCQHEAGDVCRGAPRPADGRAGPRQRRDDEHARRDVHLRRVLAARPPDASSFAELLRSVPVPERVRQALARTRRGPFQPYLELVQAIENESLIDMRECADKLMIGPARSTAPCCAALVAAAPTRVRG